MGKLISIQKSKIQIMMFRTYFSWIGTTLNLGIVMSSEANHNSQQSSEHQEENHTRSNTKTKLRSRKWCATWNNYTQEDIDSLENLYHEMGSYLIYGKENAPTTGTPHLQVFIYFKQAISMNTIKKNLTSRTIHLEVARGTFAENISYCSKDGNFTELGKRPLDPAEKGQIQKERWALCRSNAESGNWKEIDDELYIRYVKNLEWIHKRSLVQKDFEGSGKLHDRNLWLFGTTGSGKSYTAHKLAELMRSEIYLKMLNKWWDGYVCQPIVLIEEIDPETGKYLASLMKKWCDKWAFTAECKGSVAKQIRPEHVIVCSNYSIVETFPNQQDWEPIKRRFREIKLTTPVKPGDPESENWIKSVCKTMCDVHEVLGNTSQDLVS